MRSFQMQALMLSFFLTLPAPAMAGCPLLIHEIEVAFSLYKEKREIHLTRIAEFEAREKQCAEEGATISARAGTDARAEACKAMAEAADMSTKLTTSAVTCEANFRKLKEAEAALIEEFEKLREAVVAEDRYVKQAVLLQNFCTEEARTIAKLAEAYVQLESRMIDTRRRMEGTRSRYEALAASFSGLASQNSGRHGDCGGFADVAGADGSPQGGPVSNTYAQGSANGPGRDGNGQHPRPVSDITGTDESRRKSAESSSVIQAAP